MIKPLRKYHYLIWWAWAILLPVAFVMAIAVRPELLMTKKDGENAFTANISPGSDSTVLITVTVGKPIDMPSCVAILSTPETQILLGTLSRQGRYNFSVPPYSGEGTLILFDAIHQKSVASIPLKNYTVQ